MHAHTQQKRKEKEKVQKRDRNNTQKMNKLFTDQKKRIISLPQISSKVSAQKSVKEADRFRTSSAARDEKYLETEPHLEIEEEVRGSLVTYENQKQKEEFFADSDVKISRHQFGRLVLSLRAQISHFRSTGLFVHFMLQDLQRKEGADVATLAAAGTWGLQLLVNQEVGSALESIQSALLPALYCDYNPQDLPFASAAIQAQIHDSVLVEENPYFTHSMYVEQARIGLKNIEQLNLALHRSLEHNEGRRRYVLRMIGTLGRKNVQYHFTAWRQLARRRHVLDMTAEKRQKRHESLNDVLRLRMVFSTWRLTVENARVQFLTDRLHDVSLQLENSKNQFQLQCFRSDRLLQLMNQAKKDQEAVLAKELKLKARISEIKKELRDHELIYKERITTTIESAFSTIQHYRNLLTFLVDTRQCPKIFTRMPKSSGVGESFQDQKNEEEEDNFAEIVIQWCNYAVREVLGSSYQPFSFLCPEFFTGEFYLIVLHFVFPERTSLQVNRDSNIPYRLRRICEMCEACCLLHRLVPDDFTLQREDLIFLSLGELFRRYLLDVWGELSNTSSNKASAAFPQMLLDSKKVDLGGDQIEVINGVFTGFIEDCETDVESKKTRLMEQFELEKDLTRNTNFLVKEESYMWGERVRGAPLQALSAPTRRMFSRLNPPSFEDVISKLEKSAEESFPNSTLSSLQQFLFSDHTLSRIFFHYAGDGAKQMSEASFWRFVEQNKFHSSTTKVSKATIAQIFNKVNFPQLDAAKHAAKSGKSLTNVETLVLAAKYEVNIRYLSPGQFVEIVIRIAVEYARNKLSVLESVKQFLEVLRTPSSQQLPPITRDFYSRDVQHVIQFFSDELFRVFNFFLRNQEQSKFPRDRLIAVQDGGRFGALISRRNFENMFIECGYLNVEMHDRSESQSSFADGKSSSSEKKNSVQTRKFFVTEEEIGAVLGKLINASNSAVESTSGATSFLEEHQSMPQHLELTFTMFLETFGVFCQYWCPDPFVPYSRKVAAFIAHTLRQLADRHTSDTLVLANLPSVSLEGGTKAIFGENAQ